jgi:arginine exporter protein ArgO
MNWIKKIIVFSGLMLLFIFAFTADKNTIRQTEQEKTSSSTITTKSIHSSVFIEPTHCATFIINHKTIDTPIIKWISTFLVTIPDFKKHNFHNTFFNQNINRCLSVSILLFPFHYFW